MSVLTIPRPHPLPPRKGAAALHECGKAYALKLHHNDADLVRAEAQELGITRSELMRWLVVYGAAELHRLRTGETVEVVP